MSSFKELENIPWFAVAGGLVLLSLLLYTTTDPDFWTSLFPTYMTEAIVFIALGLGLNKKETEADTVGFEAFMMSGVWLLDQLLHWSGLGGSMTPLKAPLLWMLFLAQAFFGYLFFSGQKVKYVAQGGKTWIYAAVGVIFIFALGKAILGLAYTLPIMLPLWGIGILILSLGCLLKPAVPEWSIPIQLLGVALAGISALTIAGPGLAVL